MKSGDRMRKTISSLKLGLVYSYIHFSVEVACFYFLFSRLSSSPVWWIVAMAFDALAFVPQGFIGIIADKFPKFNYGLLGCAMLLVSLLIPFDAVALVILCLGNALAHIGGAQKTLRTSGGKITPTSLFVGGGSFGVITGQLLGVVGNEKLIVIPLALMALCVVLLFFVEKLYSIKEKEWKLDITTKHSVLAITLIAFAVVAVRAYIAYAIPTGWKKSDYQAVLLFVIMGIGKMLGGVFADLIGYYKTALISGVLALPFLLFGNSYMILSLIGVGLFSMTMPITIAILVSKFPDRPCFSFGITTVALFAGTLPAFFIRPTTLLQHQLTVLILIIIATISLLVCIKRRKIYEFDAESNTR